MQHKNWNDFRYLLALKRSRTLSGAAKLVGVDETTVSRRLSALQKESGSILFSRYPDGTWQLTSTGEDVALNIEAIERRVERIADLTDSDHVSCTGNVRLTSVPILINKLFTPQIKSLLDQHPSLNIDLVPDSRDFSLSHREADLAVRLARPKLGGSWVKVRRVGIIHYGVYVARGNDNPKAGSHRWITYGDDLAHIPQAKWIKRVIDNTGQALVGLKVYDAQTAQEAVAAGLGCSVLPIFVADKDVRLVRCDEQTEKHCPSRDVWLLSQADQSELPRIRAVVQWLEKVIK